MAQAAKARQKKSAKSAKLKVAEPTSNATAPATRIGEMPSKLPHRESHLEETQNPTIKIHRPHQERNPEREKDDAALGTGAALKG